MKALAVKGPRCEGKDNVVVVDGGGGDGARRRSQRRWRKNRMPTENGTGIRSRLVDRITVRRLPVAAIGFLLVMKRHFSRVLSLVIGDSLDYGRQSD
ncbi:hypothetical protein V6N11_061865 [Hibiscus sabdariffa]|uniref:Uncharacterized protein n=1 Tax=Hibiscus sabdariffa TaxID=183260 RepID=A0ABR1ZQL6_9ROSI